MKLLQSHSFAASLAAFALIAIAFVLPMIRRLFSGPKRSTGFANTYDEAVETTCGEVQYKVDDTVSSRHLLFKQGSDANHLAICGAAYRPLGTVDNKSLVAEDRATLLALGFGKTVKMVASAAISAGDNVYTAASGKVQGTPTSAGTYYLVGQARTAAGADGDIIDVYSQRPVRVIVLALPGNANAEIGGLTIGGTYSQSEVQALRDKTEELADDFRALSGGVAEPSMIMWLAS